MMDWMARARAEILKEQPPATDKTDKTPVSAVLSVPQGATSEKPEPLSSVSSVGEARSFKDRILAHDLVEAAMKVCERYGDGPAAREEMRQQCLALSPQHQADLLEYFGGVKRKWKESDVPDWLGDPRPAHPDQHGRTKP